MRFEMAVPNMYFVHGSGKVFDLLESKAGITGIGVNTIMEELTGPEQGSRFPSMVDKLNRPLDGKDVIYVRNHSTFEPDLSLYKETNIRPPMPIPGTKRDVLREALTEGKKRGFFFSIMDASLAIPPQHGQDKGEQFGYPWWAVVDDEYKAVRIDGKYISGVESKSCPNNPDIRKYVFARARDIVQHYPEIDAYYVDHLEFPTYTFEDSFSCFCGHCIAKGKTMGYDLENIREELMPYFAKIERLSQKELDELFGHPALARLSQFRWECIREFAGQIRQVIKEASHGSIAFGMTGFTPAFSLLGSKNYDEIADYVDIALPKFYPEHWTVVLSLWLKKLCSSNPNMTDAEALEVIYKHLGWEGSDLPMSAAEIDADKRLLVPMRLVDVEARRAITAIDGKAEICPTIHGWGSAQNWQEKMGHLEKNGLGGYIWGLFHVTDEQMEITRQVAERNKPNKKEA